MDRKTILVAGGLVVAVLIGVAAGVWFEKRSALTETVVVDEAAEESPASTDKDSLSSTGSTNQKIDLFGTMMALQTSRGFAGDKALESLMETSWLTLRDHTSSFNKFVTTMENGFGAIVRQLESIGYSSNRDVVGAFVWNVVQPEKDGSYDWTLADAVMKAAGEAGITVSAVMHPFAGWDTTEEVDPNRCVGIDFAYFDHKVGAPKDIDAYTKWVTATVERYDGDGVDDMDGLKTRVEAWEIGNEEEGPCGGDLATASVYVPLLKTTYETIKAADPTALVLNAGALEIVGGGGQEISATKEYWKSFFALGGGKYVNIFNMHYNREREGADATADVWLEHLDFFNGLMQEQGLNKPIWLTEFGTYSGSPSARPVPTPPAGHPAKNPLAPPSQSEAFQAAWYFRYTVMGFEAGVRRYFVDLSGKNNTGIGGSALLDERGEARSFLDVLKTLGLTLDGMTRVERLAEGEYVFTTPQATVYALWSGSVPERMPREGRVLSMTGTTVHAGKFTEKDLTNSEDAPILVVVE
jgi:hypothetical protein